MNDDTTTLSPRSRTLLRIGLPLALVLVLVVIWVAAGRSRVPADTVGLLDSAIRGDRALAPGTHFTLPGLEEVILLDPYRRETTLEWSSPEGTRLEAAFEVDLRLTPEGAGALLDSGDGDGPIGRLDAALDALAADVIEASPRTEALPDLDHRSDLLLAEKLAAFGSVEGQPLLGYDIESPSMRALVEGRARRKLLGLAQDTGNRILIVGLDGADWQIARPLIERGLLPNLESLRRRGAWGNIKTLTPVLSPLIWTSIATGVKADRHGVLDFLVVDGRTGQKVPVNSRYRKVRALWNIFSDAGRDVDFVAWWATWPSEEIQGHMISDRVSYSLFDFSVPAEGTGLTHPPEYLFEIGGELIGDDSITFEEVRRFADVTREEFEAERALIAGDRAEAYERPLNHLTKILASTRNYHTIALDLLARGQADLAAFYYQGIDEVGHRFMHFAPPRMDGVSAEDFRRYGKVIERFYIYQDELLGELLRAAARETTVIVVSDHGFVNGPDRPRGMTADIEGQPARWHRRYGVLILAGPPVARLELDTTSMLDITPTVLRLAGLPVADDMQGRVLEEALRPEFAERYPETRIATYESVPLRQENAPLPEAMAAVEAEVMENLRALGYIGGGADGTAPAAAVAGADSALEAEPGADGSAGTVTAHTNLAGVLLSNGDLEVAEREILAALELMPTYPTARRQLFDLRLRQDRPDEAISIARQMISDGLVEEPRLLARLAEVYHDTGRDSEGIRLFRDGISSGHPELGVPLSRLLIHAGDLAGADRAARTVLANDPMNEAALASAYKVAEAEGRLTSLLPLLNEALEINPRSVMHLNWLAVVRESAGNMNGAETALRSVLEIDPDHGGAMANLGAFYARHGRAADAVPLLERALRIEPGNMEARINLGTALARLGRVDEAAAEFERAVEAGSREVGVYNALARIHGERGNIPAAAGWLRRSLEIDPDQEPIRRLLESIEPAGNSPGR